MISVSSSPTWQLPALYCCTSPYTTFTPRSKWLPDKIWSLLAVSLVAQAVTFPLGLYAFHQFPNYFLLTNLVAVPLSSLVIYCGIFTLAVGAIPVLSMLSARVFSLLVWLLNRLISGIGDLPFSATTGISLSLAELLIVYGMIISFFSFFILKRKGWLFVFLGLTVVLAAGKLVGKIRVGDRSMMVIYQVKNGSMYDFISGSSHYLLKDIRTAQPDDYTRQMLENHYTSEGITTHFTGYMYPCQGTVEYRQFYPAFLYRSGHFIGFGGKRIAILNRRLPAGSHFTPMRVDYLIIGSETGNDPAGILKMYHS